MFPPAEKIQILCLIWNKWIVPKPVVLREKQKHTFQNSPEPNGDRVKWSERAEAIKFAMIGHLLL